MKTTINEARRTVRQTAKLNVSPAYGVLPTVTIETKARLDRQYSAFAASYQPLQFLQRIFPGTRDELVREYGWDIYERIAQDAMISGILRDIVMGVVTQRPQAISEGNDERANAMAQFVNLQFGLLEARNGVSLLEVMRQMLRSALVYGHVVAEMVFDVEPSSDEFALEPLTNSFFTLRKLVPLMPGRYSFALTGEGDMMGIVPLQYFSGTPFVVQSGGARLTDPMVVPRIKLFHAVFGRMGLDPTGESLLLPAFKPWATKKQIEEHLLLLIKRIRKSWLGILPPEAQTVCIVNPETGEEEFIRPKEELLEVLQALANGDGGVVPAGTQVQAFDIEVNAAAQLLLEAHKLNNREILRAIYSRMLANNNDAAASTTGEFDRDMVAKTIRGIRAWWQDSLRQFAQSLIALNFGQTAAALFTPEIIVGRGDGLPITVKDVSLLHQSGWFTRAQKAEIDEQLGLPPDDGGELIGVNSGSFAEEAQNEGEQDDGEQDERMGQSRVDNP